MNFSVRVPTVFLLLLAVAGTARILALFPLGCKSHKLAAVPIIEALAQKGHTVVLFSPYKPVKETTNIVEYQLDGIPEFLGDLEWFTQLKESQLTQATKIMNNYLDGMIKTYNSLRDDNRLRWILDERQFDLIFADGYSMEYFPLIHHLDIPFVNHVSTGALIGTLHQYDGSKDYAFVPDGFTNLDDRMTFMQRAENFLSGEMGRLMTLYYITYPIERLIKQDFPHFRGLLEASQNVDLILSNSHHTSGWLRSMPPNVISLGSVHTRPANPLDEPFKSFADGADQGFIIFTLGSLIQVSQMPLKIKEAFVNAFARLPQKVILKWETLRSENVPVNILMTNWLPQNDLLGHPNARLFISHGGLLGFQEAIYHGVPILGLPLGSDQKSNLAKAKKEGFGIKLDWNQVNEEMLYETITRMINDPSFRGNATRLSLLTRDALRPAKDVAVYWIEYVLRHNGTKHLHLSSKRMPFYQRWLLDVIFLLAAIVITTLLFICAICYCTIGKFLKRSPKIKVKTN